MTVVPLSIGWLVQTASIFTTQATGQAQMAPISAENAITFLSLMFGPFQIISPFAQMTRGAEAALIRRIAFRAILFAGFTLLLTAFLGEQLLAKYDIALPVLTLAVGIILFLVALLPTVQQFKFNLPPRSEREIEPQR